MACSFAYDGAQVAFEMHHAAGSRAAAVMVRSFAYGQYLDEPTLLIDESTDKLTFPIHDRRFSVTALANEAGTVVERTRYQAFGQMTVYEPGATAGAWVTRASQSNPNQSAYQNPYGYTGRRYDPETATATSGGQGLWYYRNRMYSSRLGRFLQRDPAGYVDGFNLYAYVRNNPLGFVDPSGLVRYDRERTTLGYFPSSKPNSFNLTPNSSASIYQASSPRTLPTAQVLVAFDGTGNHENQRDDIFPTTSNVHKFREAYGGQTIYLRGVGNEAEYSGIAKVAGGIGGYGADAKISEALEQYAQAYAAHNGNINLDVTGFSRGGAMAIAFANRLRDEGIPDYNQPYQVLVRGRSRGSTLKLVTRYHRVYPEIRFLGVYDTVGSFGVPGNHIDLGKDLSTPTNSRVVRHAMSLDERRSTFEPVYLDHRSNVQTTFFAGVHSNVGGSYVNEGLSDITLGWMVEQARAAGVEFNQAKLEGLNIRGNPGGEIRDSYTEFAVNNTPGWLPEGSGLLVQGEYVRRVRAGDYIHRSVFERANLGYTGYRQTLSRHLSDPSIPIQIDQTEYAE